MSETQEKKWIISGLIMAGFVLSVLAVFTGTPAGGADNYAHFNIARWAFRYPHLFLDHWGKPVFTILTAPVSQFGFLAVRIFNIVCGIITSWFSYKLALHLKLKFAWFTIFMVVFNPIYFVMMSSGMTEILFSLTLIISLYLFFKEKFFLSAFVISFIFLIRTEGLAFLVLYLVGLLAKKQYKVIPVLGTGFLVFSIIGGLFYYHDFLWLISKRPYAIGGPLVYGRGSWYYFLEKMPVYFGYIIPVFLFSGTVIIVLQWIRGKASFKTDAFFLVLLVLGCFWSYFFVHSYLWWKGESSAGLQRVMAGVSPLAAVIGIYVLNVGSIFIRMKKIFHWGLITFSIVLVLIAAKFYFKSVKRDLSSETLKRTTQWLKESGSLKYKLIIHNPYFAFSTKLDAWNTDVVQYGFSNNNIPENGLPDSTLFIWDAHFSANEGGLPIEKIMNNPNFEVVHVFEPENPVKVLGNNDYKILVFRKITNAVKNNYNELERLKKEAFEKGVYFGEIYDFQLAFPNELMESKRFQSEKDTSNWEFNLLGEEYSPEFIVHKEKFEKDTKNRIRVLLDICSSDSIGKNHLFMVCSVENNFKSIHYEALDIAEQLMEINVWSKTEFIFKVPDKLPEVGILKIYIWNIDKRNVLIDNFRFDISRQLN